MQIVKANKLPIRFLYKIGDKYRRLFWFKYLNNEFYFGLSLKRLKCALELNDVLYSDGIFQILSTKSISEDTFNLFKFSYHNSGERHIRVRKKGIKEDFELFKEISTNLLQMQNPILLFAHISKNISQYPEYNSDLNKDNKNAMIFDTPIDFKSRRNIFEYYAAPTNNLKTESFIISDNVKYETCCINFSNNISILIKYIVNDSENNSLGLMNYDKDIFIFKTKMGIKSIIMK